MTHFRHPSFFCNCGEFSLTYLPFLFDSQAADVAHTIQHWQTFSKFHERLFSERFTAFVNGDEASDPALTWYDDQLAYFDKVVIPLVEKLQTSGVFGSTGEEFMRWAQQNRNEWAAKGRSVVRHMRDNASSQYQKMNVTERRRQRRASMI